MQSLNLSGLHPTTDPAGPPFVCLPPESFTCLIPRKAWIGAMGSLTDVDTIVVGAGPIGLELGVALKQRGMDFAIIEANQVGHTIGWYAPGTHFFSSPERISIAGVPLMTRDQGKATREEYLDYLMGVAWQFDLPIYSGMRFKELRSLNKLEGSTSYGWELGIERCGAPEGSQSFEQSRLSIRCRNLILAIGDMHKPRMLGIPGENQANVSHYLQELRHYFRQYVVIVGGRNSAVEAAIRIYRMGGRVTIVYRGSSLDDSGIKYWLYPEIASLIKNGMIRFLNEAQVTGIEGNRLFYRRKSESGPDSRPDSQYSASNFSDSGQNVLQKATNPTSNDTDSKGPDDTKSAKSRPERWFEATQPETKDSFPGQEFLIADQFLLLTGYVPDNSFYDSLGIELSGTEQKPSLNAETMETNLEGVFVAGTAIAGSQQRHTVFIENSHEHVQRIVETISKRAGGKAGGAQTETDRNSLKGLYEEYPES